MIPEISESNHQPITAHRSTESFGLEKTPKAIESQRRPIASMTPSWHRLGWRRPARSSGPTSSPVHPLNYGIILVAKDPQGHRAEPLLCPDTESLNDGSIKAGGAPQDPQIQPQPIPAPGIRVTKAGKDLQDCSPTTNPSHGDGPDPYPKLADHRVHPERARIQDLQEEQ